MTLPSFSLVGALEFRSVISSLQQEATGTSLGVFEPSLSPYPGGHYHSFGHSRSRSGTIRSASPHLSDGSSDVPLSDRSPLPQASSRPTEGLGPSLPAPLIPIDSDAEPQIPQILHTPASPQFSTNNDIAHHAPPTRRQRIRLVLAHALHILFPTLHQFHTKSLLGRVAGVFATPAVFLLTITLPVVVRPFDSLGSRHEKAPSVAHSLSTIDEDDVDLTLIAEEEVLGEMHELQFNKWLVAVQCAFGPLFCAAVLFSTLICDIICRRSSSRVIDI